MLLYEGKSPFSSFRLNKLIKKIQHVVPSITNIYANYIYFINGSELTEREQIKLAQIIDPGSKPWELPSEDSIVFVTPRFGTKSPWSSKATDILHVCGFHTIHRIERGIAYRFTFANQADSDQLPSVLPFIHDRMVETCSLKLAELTHLFREHEVTALPVIELDKVTGQQTLATVNQQVGLALSKHEIDYLFDRYLQLGKNPTETELMMFGQINSEHCRHKIFNARWTFDGQTQPHSLFSMIKNTHAAQSEGVLSAYKDNGAVIAGHVTENFFPDFQTKTYQHHSESCHIVIKVETHNHPTAIAPFEGAATGAGGEIRDEGATGRGGKPKAGLVGFTVSNLNIPQLPQPWEKSVGYPSHIATSLDIMLQGPIGAAAFNNEFGRPSICGYFRSFEMFEERESEAVVVRGYHKPIMIAGGMGQIRPTALKKNDLPVGAKIIVLGGPAMLIGLGGGTASSLSAGQGNETLDFASVQRSNPEMERRCQEVINTCFWLGDHNPIISIHDVGAGGLSNALPELVHDAERGAVIQLSAIPSADSSLNATELWCNEAQERYVLAINLFDLPLFQAIADRERCPFAVLGEATHEQTIKLQAKQDPLPVNLPLNFLFGEAGAIHKQVVRTPKKPLAKIAVDLTLSELIQRVLQLPSVADKSFLITIGDRTVTGLVARDQMVGPWQVPVADVAVTSSGYNTYQGEAMAMGERSPVALIDACASVRLAIGESITNLMAADIQKLSDIKLSANWMAAANHGQEDSLLFDAVKAVGLELCPELGICIPVGKDSLSMQMKWEQDDYQYNVVSPLSLIISAFSPVTDVRKTLTPMLAHQANTELLLLDLGAGKNRLGGSALAQVTHQLGNESADLEDPSRLIHFVNAIKSMRDQDLLLAYHDRSDGGLLATICEMSFASHVGLSLEIGALGDDPIAVLFNEELGVVIQYKAENRKWIEQILMKEQLTDCAKVIGTLNDQDQIVIHCKGKLLFEQSRVHLQRLWSETSYQLKSLRDNPTCALQEYDALLEQDNPGLQATLTFAIPGTPPAIIGTKPKVAILREQGVNGQLEMAAAFDRAGFQAIDVHMTDLLTDKIKLTSFQGIVACGGFSYGDVFGAGRGWANSILYNEKARDQFSQFFNLTSVFVLGVCNGCQMLSQLKELIPGASAWPQFVRNVSEQFEARLSLVKINHSKSIFFKGMEGSILPIAVSHGEGQVVFEDKNQLQQVIDKQLITLQFVDNYEKITEKYPANPNGSPLGITALTNEDGRFTIMMPHAERVFRTSQLSWHPEQWQENSPWFQLFVNARNWLR